MDRLRRVSQVWAWLPAFRAVAEVQHLRRAAERLHIAPSALSRAVGLIEEDLGITLFERAGRNIALTPQGQVLLQAVRDAMRLIHAGLTELESSDLSGPLRIAAPSTITRMILLPAIRELRRAYAGLRPTFESVPHAALAMALGAGDLDVAFTNDAVSGVGLTCRPLGRYSSGVYCGVGHPLFGAHADDPAALLPHAFVAPPADLLGHPRDGWPIDLPRFVDIEVADLQVGIELCLDGTHLAVLPDRLAIPDVERGTLFRLAVDVVPPRAYFASHRSTLTRAGAAEALLLAVERTAAAS